MKLQKLTSVLILIFVFGVISLTGCLKTDDNEPTINKKFNELKVPEEFTWRTSKTLRIDVLLVNQNQVPVSNEISFYTEYPNGSRLLAGYSGNNGKFTRKYTVASSRNSIVAVIPGQDPITLNFVEKTINGFPAWEVAQTIVVQNPGLKSTTVVVPSSAYPADGQFGTIAFEDSWPHQADYDFNDVVIDYNVQAIYEDDLVAKIEMLLYLRAAGAANDNGFGISFRQYWSYQGPYPDIASVKVNGNVIQPENTVYPSYILIPSTKAIMPVYNTFMNNPFDYPISFFVEILFAEPTDQWDLELPLQSPFIFVNQDRGREVHLPYDLPTSLANPSWAGQGKDATDPAVFNPDNFKSIFGNFTYMTQQRYPFALHIYFETGSDELFHYPAENKQITEAYSSFQGWVENWDPWEWYLPQYRMPEHIYSKIPNPPYNLN